MCLTAQGFSSQHSTWLEDYLALPEQKAMELREELKDAKKLRSIMMERLFNSSWRRYIFPEQAEEFKRRSGMSDKTMETVLLDIIREWSIKGGWSSWESRPDSQAARIGHGYLTEAIKWLGFCADTKGKKLLMAIATDSVKDNEFRSLAIASYMLRANAKETLDALPRFLADDMRTALHPSFDIYFCALSHYDKAEGNPQKREAILSSVSAALTNEEEKKAFAEADKRLAELSTDYAESPQRKAALERMNKPPEKPVP